MVLQTFDILNQRGNPNFNIYMYQLRINFIFVFRSMIFLYGKGGWGQFNVLLSSLALKLSKGEMEAKL